MDNTANHKTPLEQALLAHIPKKELRTWMRRYALPYQELMAYYRCAIMEVETKFRVLNEAMSLEYDRNPIESIKSRLKSPENIVEKILARGYPLTTESIEEHVNDVAGVRVICSFPSEIYMLADALLKQDDVKLLKRKDYIEHPKENGYRSLHLIISTPIFLHNEKRMMKVEVQLRTLAMDLWASAEHKIRYKKDILIPEQVSAELCACAEIAAELDERLEQIRRNVEHHVIRN